MSEANPSSSPSASPPPANEAQAAQDLTIFVQSLLQQMQTRFSTMSNAIIGRIDEMGSRIDDLEKSIAELMTQAGIEEEADKKQGGATPAAAATAAQ